jgi:hypothetical protein
MEKGGEEQQGYVILKKHEIALREIRNSKQIQMTKTVNQKQDKRKRGRAEERKKMEVEKQRDNHWGNGY